MGEPFVPAGELGRESGARSNSSIETALSHCWLGVPTTAVTALDVLLWKLGPFPYWAVMESLAIGNATERLAIPPLTLAVPREVPLAKNVTFPLKVPGPGLTMATVAASVTSSRGQGSCLRWR